MFEWTRDIGRGKNFGEIFFFVLFKNSEHVVAEKHEERCWLMAHSGGRSRIKLAKKETTSRGAWNNGAEVGRESKILKYLRCRVRTLERDTRLSMLPAESEDGERVRGTQKSRTIVVKKTRRVRALEGNVKNGVEEIEFRRARKINSWTTVGSKFSPFKDLGNFHERRYRWEKSLEIFAGGMVEKIGGNKEREGRAS